MKPKPDPQDPCCITYQGKKLLQRYVDRFPTKYRQLDGPTGCWQWLGSVNSGGTPTYGIGKHPGKNDKVTHRIIGAHKLSFVMKFGDKYGHSVIKRSCRNLRCVNPDHMYVEIRD